MGAINFTETLHDFKTIPEASEQYERFSGKEAKKVFVDRGYKGLKQYKSSIPTPNKNITRQQRRRQSKSAAIALIIGT